jgi:hypothetical protein
MRENSSRFTMATWQTRGFDGENAGGTVSAKAPRKRMSFGPELILILAAIVALGLVGLCGARAADGELVSPKGVPKTVRGCLLQNGIQRMRPLKCEAFRCRPLSSNPDLNTSRLLH